MVQEQSWKINKIFQIIDELNIYNHYAFKTIVFSDTILIFNEQNNYPNHYFVTFLIEFAQNLFYKLLPIGVYFKGLITYGEFNFEQKKHIQAYWGNALIETYNNEKNIKGFGLFINKKLSDDVITFDKLTNIDDKYDFILLCQSYINLYKNTQGKLPINIETLTQTDEYMNIDEDLRFFRELKYIKDNYPDKKIIDKYSTVYMWYSNYTSSLFKQLENDDFLPFALNPNYMGKIYPFDIIAEKELQNKKQQSDHISFINKTKQHIN